MLFRSTGCGKTEISRRLARLAEAPFIKVEATKFTEVGYVGRDVDTIIRDLAEIAVKQTRELEMKRWRSQAEDAAEDRILDVLIAPARAADGSPIREETATRQTFRKRLREGHLDATEIAGGDTLALHIDAEPDRDRLALKARLAAPVGGLVTTNSPERHRRR